MKPDFRRTCIGGFPVFLLYTDKIFFVNPAAEKLSFFLFFCRGRRKGSGSILNCAAFHAALSFFPAETGETLALCGEGVRGSVYEIRLYADKAVVFVTDAGLFFCCKNGNLSSVCPNCPLRLSAQTLFEILNRAAGYALFERETETRSAFLTANGCRIGISGLSPDGRLLSGGIRSLNIRVPFSSPVTADGETLSLLREKESVLIAGSPGSGKTTMLKKLIYALAAGQAGVYRRVSVIDTRGEFAGFVGGTPEILTADVISFGEKGRSVETALRLFSPEYLVCDEVGSVDETRRLLEGVKAGVQILAGIHARDLHGLLRRPQFKLLWDHAVFDRIAFLSDKEAGKLVHVYDAQEVEQMRSKVCV